MRKYSNFSGSLFMKYFPIILIVTYLTFTILLFKFGPFDYPIKNSFKLYSFLIAVNFLLIIGYFFGVNKIERIGRNTDLNKLFKFTLILQILLIPLTSYLVSGSFFLNFENISNRGQAYIDSILLRESGASATIIAYLRIVLSPFLIIFFPLGLYLWRELSIKSKFLFVITTISVLSIDFIRGTNKILADYLIVFIIMIIIKILYNSQIFKSIIASRKYIFLKLSLVIVISLFLLNLFFNSFIDSTEGREGALNTMSPNGEYSMDLDNFLLEPFDDTNTKILTGLFISYFTQGYYALDLALSKPFLPTYGIGSSMAVLINVSESFNTHYFFNRTYVMRNDIQDGWDWHGQWSTFYVWVASDITFFGVLALVFLIGYIMGRAWTRAIKFKEFISVVVVLQLVTMCLYFPANNQLFQFFEGMIGNSIIFLAWILKIKNISVRW